MSVLSTLNILLLDAWRAIRELLRRPSYLLLATLTLALGVAATSAAFSLLDLALLRSLPFKDPQRLMVLGMERSEGIVTAAPLLYAAVRDLEEAQSMSIVRAGPTSTNLATGAQSIVAQTLLADHRFLSTLDARLALGRNFDANEDRPGSLPVMVLSYEFWSRQLGGDPAILNRTVQVEGTPARVIGVLSADFQWPGAFDSLMPLQLSAENRDAAFNEYIVVRLRDGITPNTLDIKVDAMIRAAIAADRPRLDRGNVEFLNAQRYGVRPLESLLVVASGDSLRLLFGAAVCVLLIATLNLVSLTIVRGLSRSHNHAVRSALGASATRVALPALAEGLLIGIAGATLGAVTAWLLLELLAAFVPPEWLRGTRAGITSAGMVFAFAVGIGVGVLAASVGVWSGRSQSSLQELASGGRSGWSRRASGLGRAMVIAQVSVAVVLLLGAALIGRQLLQLTAVPMGFETRSILTFTLAPLTGIYGDIDAVDEQTRRVLTRLQQLPGVEAAGAASNLPTGSQLNFGVSVGNADDVIVTQFRPVTASFMETFRLEMLRGRAFTAPDGAGAEPVCIVSSAFVEKHLSGDPLGQRVRLRFGTAAEAPAMRVIGVVSDVRQFGPAVAAPPILYLPLIQVPDKLWTRLRVYVPLSYAVRVRGAPEGYEAALRAALREVEPLQPIANVRSMHAVVASTTGAQRLTLLVIGIFAASALLLAGVGLYAVMAVTVAARQHEFGVRAAMGAQPADLLRMVLRESGVQLGFGLLIGLLVTFGASRAIAKLLFGANTADPLAIAAVLAVLLVAGVLASLSPARRAARTHPMQVLRAQ
jgi:putative ABC transport system permease protein